MLALLAVLLLLSACWSDDYMPVVQGVKGSVYTDGSGIRHSDLRLCSSIWGNPVYISEDQVLHIGNKVYSRALGSSTVRQLIPDNLEVTDQESYDLDLANQMLYIAINHHIYRIKLDGSQVTDLSTAEVGSLYCPVLSDCGNYLTALRDGKIIRLNLQTGIWENSPVPFEVEYAVFISQNDTYYYFTGASVEGDKALWSWEVASSNITEIMQLTNDLDDCQLNLGLSRDRRFFAIHQNASDWYGTVAGDLKLYDRITNQVSTISNVHAYSFSLSEPKLFYSRKYKGLADLKYQDLETGNHSLIWDGYYSQTAYSSSLTKIYPRADNAHIFFTGYKAFRNSKNQNKISGL